MDEVTLTQAIEEEAATKWWGILCLNGDTFEFKVIDKMQDIESGLAYTECYKYWGEIDFEELYDDYVEIDEADSQAVEEEAESVWFLTLLI